MEGSVGMEGIGSGLAWARALSRAALVSSGLIAGSSAGVMSDSPVGPTFDSGLSDSNVGLFFYHRRCWCWLRIGWFTGRILG